MRRCKKIAEKKFRSTARSLIWSSFFNLWNPVVSILFVTSKSLGGSGKYISALSNGIKSVPREIVFYPSGVSQDKEVESGFDDVHHFSKRPSFNPLSLIKNVLQVRRLLLTGKYKIVHTHTSLGGFMGRLGAFFSGTDVKVIHTIHAYGADEFTPSPQKWVYWLIEKFLDLVTDTYISPSGYMVEYGKRIHLINAKKAVVIYNSLPLRTPGSEKATQRENVRSRLGLTQAETVFLFCGRLERQKGVDVMLDAVAAVKSGKPFKVLVCGDGDLRDELHRQAATLGIEQHIVWLGWQSEIAEFYAAADVYLMPSRWESFGLVFLEAMNYHLPILSTKTQAIPEVVEDGVCGLLSDNENAGQLAKNIDRLLEDVALCKEMGERGNERLNKLFSFEIFIQSHLDVYRKNGVQPVKALQFESGARAALR